MLAHCAVCYYAAAQATSWGRISSQNKQQLAVKTQWLGQDRDSPIHSHCDDWRGMRDASQIFIINDYQWYWTKYREAQTLASDDSGKRQTEKKVMSDQQWPIRGQDEGQSANQKRGEAAQDGDWATSASIEETRHQQISSNCLMSSGGEAEK